MTDLELYEESVRLIRRSEECPTTEAGFVGLLGSRRKRETLLALLKKEGVDEEQRNRVITPACLDLGAQTSEEIVVSIVGQLIRLRKKP